MGEHVARGDDRELRVRVGRRRRASASGVAVGLAGRCGVEDGARAGPAAALRSPRTQRRRRPPPRLTTTSRSEREADDRRAYVGGRGRGGSRADCRWWTGHLPRRSRLSGWPTPSTPCPPPGTWRTCSRCCASRWCRSSPGRSSSTAGTPSTGRLIATALFVVAAATDRLDGWLARRSGQVTDLGKLLDPIADKVLIGTALVLLSLARGPAVVGHRGHPRARARHHGDAVLPPAVRGPARVARRQAEDRAAVGRDRPVPPPARRAARRSSRSSRRSCSWAPPSSSRW